jgi:hypothetical protein
MRLKRYLWIFLTGLALSGGLYVLVNFGGDSDLADPGPVTEIIPEDVQPANFRQISEFEDGGIRRLRLSGEAEPGGVIVLTDKGERLHQVRADEDGQWSVALGIDEMPMVLNAQLYTEEGGPSIRSDETIFRLPVPNSPEVATDNFVAPALVLVSAPGGPSRIIQSPFGAAPTSGPLSLGAIDYDDLGGVIISGTSEVPGRVRLYAENSVIGETRIGLGGRWNYIGGRILPRGEYEIRAELIPATRARESDERILLSVPFALLPPLASGDDESGALTVNYQPLRWQVRRTLIGGGGQSTVIFSPDAAEQFTPPAPPPEE